MCVHTWGSPMTQSLRAAALGNLDAHLQTRVIWKEHRKKKKEKQSGYYQGYYR